MEIDLLKAIIRQSPLLDKSPRKLCRAFLAPGHVRLNPERVCRRSGKHQSRDQDAFTA